MEQILAETVQSSFSIVVAAYLLVRMEGRLDELAKAISGLQQAIMGRGDVREVERYQANGVF